jgi:mono/diheme cytochrome c family protein
MNRTRLVTLSFLALGLAGIPAVAAEPPPSPQAAEFFEKHVRPLLADNCQSCHGAQKQRSGLRLDSRAALLKGGDSGPVVKPGDPDNSPLIQAVRQTGDLKMPPKGKLSPEAVEALAAWVKMGLPWPESATPAPAASDWQSVFESRRRHWSFQPVRKPAVPAVKDRSWPHNAVDAFILAKLEEKGLTPAAPADRHTLIRRLTLDLIGLPPAPEEVAAFEADTSPDAVARVVDRLLASPQYGECWGRHWLDVARYADTRGYVFEEERRYPYSYTYRDYVVRAFNDDLPYDQFVVQQLAADRLPLGDDKAPLAALGFLTLGRRFLNNAPDIIDDRIDVVMRGLQGLTVTCARCHDHKFDPIPQKDYYSLYGVFASSVEPKDLPVLAGRMPSPASMAFEKELAGLEKEADGYAEEHKQELQSKNRAVRDELRKRRKKVEQLKVTHPGAPPCAMVLVDASQPVEPHVFLRGNPNNPGEAVPRQFLQVLAGDGRRPFADGSGRLDLARAIADKDNPLTARVLVNRVWQHHFGEGLVRTPGDFGLRGEPPTHPELLDYLAATFVEDGWSLKKLHRMILLSCTYQQSSDPPRASMLDPDNRLVGRMNRRRLEFEPLRDSFLAVAGRLDATQGGRAVDLLKAPFTTRRTVYGFIDRQNLPGLFRTFDLASPDTSTPQRHVTTVPQQALFLMNAPFVVEQARRLASRPDVLARQEPGDRIRYLYRLLYGRPAGPEEVELGRRFLAESGIDKPMSPGRKLSAWEEYAQVLLLANEFAFVD